MDYGNLDLTTIEQTIRFVLSDAGAFRLPTERWQSEGVFIVLGVLRICVFHGMMLAEYCIAREISWSRC